MDVVNKNIDAIGGTVSIDSIEGEEINNSENTSNPCDY